LKKSRASWSPPGREFAGVRKTVCKHSLTKGKQLWRKTEQSALTCLVSAFHLKANNIVSSSAKMQGLGRRKSHAIAVILPAQNEELEWNRLTPSQSTLEATRLEAVRHYGETLHHQNDALPDHVHMPALQALGHDSAVQQSKRQPPHPSGKVDE
jgi:hypothetical protein